MRGPFTISEELKRSPIATGKVSSLEVERLRRVLRNAEAILAKFPTEANLRALNIAREALRDAGGLL